jgi:hypothetical protein
LEQRKGIFHNLQIQLCLKNRKPFVSGLDRCTVQPILLWACTRFEKTDQSPLVSNLGHGTRCSTVVQPVRQAARVRTPTCGTRATSSLSPSPIKRVMPVEASSFATSFPNAEVRTTCHSSLVSHWLPPPLGDSSHVANPRFLVLLLCQVARSSAQSFAGHRGSHEYLRPPSMSSFLLASHCR